MVFSWEWSRSRWSLFFGDFVIYDVFGLSSAPFREDEGYFVLGFLSKAKCLSLHVSPCVIAREETMCCCTPGFHLYTSQKYLYGSICTFTNGQRSFGKRLVSDGTKKNKRCQVSFFKRALWLSLLLRGAIYLQLSLVLEEKKKNHPDLS